MKKTITISAAALGIATTWPSLFIGTFAIAAFRSEASASEARASEAPPNLKLISDCRIRSEPNSRDESNFLTIAKDGNDLALGFHNAYWAEIDLTESPDFWVHSSCPLDSSRSDSPPLDPSRSETFCRLYREPSFSAQSPYFLQSAKFKVLSKTASWTKISLSFKKGFLGWLCFGQPIMNSDLFYENLRKLCQQPGDSRPKACSAIAANAIVKDVGTRADAKEAVEPSPPENPLSANDLQKAQTQQPKQEVLHRGDFAEVSLNTGFWNFQQSGEASLNFARFTELGFGIRAEFAVAENLLVGMRFARDQVKVDDLSAEFGKLDYSNQLILKLPGFSSGLSVFAEGFVSEIPSLASGACSQSCTTYSLFGVGIGSAYEFQLFEKFDKVSHTARATVRFPFLTSQSVSLAHAVGATGEIDTNYRFTSAYEGLFRVSADYSEQGLSFKFNGLGAYQWQNHIRFHLGAKVHF
jgi:hypothetical protein